MTERLPTQTTEAANKSERIESAEKYKALRQRIGAAALLTLYMAGGIGGAVSAFSLYESRGDTVNHDTNIEVSQP